MEMGACLISSWMDGCEDVTKRRAPSGITMNWCIFGWFVFLILVGWVCCCDITPPPQPKKNSMVLFRFVFQVSQWLGNERND